MTSDNSSIETLRHVARELNGRLSDIELYDPNVCTWTHPDHKPWEFILTSGKPFSRQVQAKYRSEKLRLSANREFLVVEVVKEVQTGPISLNRPNKVLALLFAGRRKVGKKTYNAFTTDGQISKAQEFVLAMPTFEALLDEANLATSEGIHILRNGAAIYLNGPSADRVLVSVQRLIDFIAIVPRPANDPDSALPTIFSALLPLVEKWAIHDDSERSAFLERLPTSVLKAFLLDVEPYVRVIDSYVDSFRGRNPSEQAILLGRLAESALEAKQIVAKRHD